MQKYQNAESCRRWRAKNKEKVAEYNAKYNAENSEAVKAAGLAYDEAHREERRIKARLQYAANREAILEKAKQVRETRRDVLNERTRQYRKSNPEAKRRSQAKRRANSVGALSPGIIKKLFALQRACCANCAGKLTTARCHLDHIEPLSKGGPNVDSNVQLLCQPCNQRKHAKDPIAFAQAEGRLL